MSPLCLSMPRHGRAEARKLAGCTLAVYTKEMSHTGRTRPTALVSATNLALTLLFPTPKSRLPSLLIQTGRRVPATAVSEGLV